MKQQQEARREPEVTAFGLYEAVRNALMDVRLKGCKEGTGGMALSAGDETRDMCVLRHNLSASYTPRTQKTLFKETALTGSQKVINILSLVVQGQATRAGWGSQEGRRIFAKQRGANEEQKVFSKQQRGPNVKFTAEKGQKTKGKGMNTRKK